MRIISLFIMLSFFSQCLFGQRPIFFGNEIRFGVSMIQNKDRHYNNDYKRYQLGFLKNGVYVDWVCNIMYGKESNVYTRKFYHNPRVRENVESVSVSWRNNGMIQFNMNALYKMGLVFKKEKGIKINLGIGLSQTYHIDESERIVYVGLSDDIRSINGYSKPKIILGANALGQLTWYFSQYTGLVYGITGKVYKNDRDLEFYQQLKLAIKIYNRKKKEVESKRSGRQFQHGNKGVKFTWF